MSARCKLPSSSFSLGRVYLLRRCRMLRFWASLLSQDRRQSGAIIRIAQCNPELGLDQVVRYALVVVVKAACHRREPGGLERHERRRLHPEKFGGIGDDRLGRCRIIVANVVDGTGPRPLHRGDQHARQILDVDAREDLTRLVDAFCGAGTQRIERAAARTVDGGEPKDVDRRAAVAPKLEPALLCGEAAPAALTGRQQSGGFVDPTAAAIAIDPGRRQIAEPGKPGQCRNITAVQGEHRVACGIGWNRDEEMGNPVQRGRIDRPLAIEQDGGEAGLAQKSLSFGTAAGAGHHPPQRDKLTAERQRAVTRAEAEEMRPAHDGSVIGMAPSRPSLAARETQSGNLAARRMLNSFPDGDSLECSKWNGSHPITGVYMPTITTKDGTEIFYKDWGSGEPIVFSHGWPLSADDWDAQLLFFLHHGYRVIAHDRRGHGRSTQTADGHDMDHYADDLAALTAHLDLKGAIHVGHSTGGGEVARYLGRHGESRVAKAALISATAADGED